MGTIYKIIDASETSAGIAVKLEHISGDELSDNLDFLISRENWLDMKLAVGDEIGKSEFAALTRAGVMLRAISRTLKILSYSDHSRNALIRKLANFGFERDIAEDAADYAEKHGYINEKEQACRAAEMYVKNKYWGKKRIAAELMSRGYSKESILFAASSITNEEYLNALKKIMRRKFAAATEGTQLSREMLSYFARLGYSITEITRATEELSSDE